MIIDISPPSRKRSLPPSKRKRAIQKLKKSYRWADILAQKLEQKTKEEAQQAEKILEQNKDLFKWD